MPTLTIDNRTVTVANGTNVLEAAVQLGIVIPHFCYHEALGAVGACRLCAMTFVEGPLKGVQMSCMVEAKDGMVVSTLDPVAVDLRRHVIEWLMMNHPHDCPVCDAGGECQLQDMTEAGNHGIRRYGGKKRTYNNQYLGPFVYHEMNRCIQCYRCVRTYQDYCGGDDFGVLGVNQRIYFGRFKDGRLESPFSGNIVEACPTGVFTDKTFRYQARYWDLQEAPSVCPHCSLGCAVIPGARYRELLRVRAGVNRQTNGFFICDRGRFGYGYANDEQRPRRVKMAGQEISPAEAMVELRRLVTETAAQHGPASVAFLGSPRATLEANAALATLARAIGSDRIAFDPHPRRDRTARTTAARLGERTRSLEEIRHSDLVLMVGADPLHEGPGMALAVRQAVRRGALAAVLDPRPVELPFHALHLPLPAQRLAEGLHALVEGDFASFSRKEAVWLEGVAARLTAARRPVLVGGGDLLGPAGVQALLDAAGALSRGDRPCGASILLPGPNSFGCALLAGSGPDVDGLLQGIAAGEIKLLLCLETDLFTDHPQPERVSKDLARLDTLVALDYLPTETVRRADLFIPTTAPAEQGGSFVNQEGRMLTFASVFEAGTPLRDAGEDHPPRTFESTTPGSDPRPAWSILSEQLISLQQLRRQLEEKNPRFARLATLDPGGIGQRVAGGAPLPAPAPDSSPAGSGLQLLVVENLYGSELLSSFSRFWREIRPEPFLLMHPQDAAPLGLAAGVAVRLRTEGGAVSVRLHLSDRMAQGAVILPRLRGTALDSLVPGAGLRRCTLEQGGGP
jgi:NADH-quinone oxidoreductase subunit G